MRKAAVTSKPKATGITLKGGGQPGDMKTLKKSLKKRAGQDIRRTPEDGITVRFLTEPEEWFEFFEHYDDTREGNYYYPCTEDDEGCQAGDKPTKRYLANAVDVDEKKVIAMLLPQSLASMLVKKYDRFKTILDRDYFLSKEGSGFSTEYDATPEPPSKMNTSRYTLFDLGKLLMTLLTDEDDEDEDETPRRSKPPVKVKRRRPTLDEDADDDDDDEDDEEEAPRRKPVRKTIVKKPPVRTATRKPVRKVIKRR